MALIGKRLKEAREKKRLTQINAAKLLGISNGTLSGYERNYRDPDTQILEKMASLYDVSIDYLIIGKEHSDRDSKLPELTPKDDRDIARDLEKIINNLGSDQGYAAYDGHLIEELDEEDKELLISSLKNSMQLAKRIAKQKFTPNKHRKNQE